MTGLLAISGWMAAASYDEYFSAPIQAITTTSPYRTSCRPATATGCSVVGASAVCRFMVRIMDDPFARCFAAGLISRELPFFASPAPDGPPLGGPPFAV